MQLACQTQKPWRMRLMWALRRCGGRATLASEFASHKVAEEMSGIILICGRQHTP